MGPLLSWWEGMSPTWYPTWHPSSTPPGHCGTKLPLSSTLDLPRPQHCSPGQLSPLASARQVPAWTENLLPQNCFSKNTIFSCRATFHPKCFLSITPFLTVYYEVMLGVTDSTWRKWGTERFDDLGKTTQLVSGRASPWIQFSWQTFRALVCCCPCHAQSR